MKPTSKPVNENEISYGDCGFETDVIEGGTRYSLQVSESITAARPFMILPVVQFSCDIGINGLLPFKLSSSFETENNVHQLNLAHAYFEMVLGIGPHLITIIS